MNNPRPLFDKIFQDIDGFDGIDFLFGRIHPGFTFPDYFFSRI